MSGAPPGQTLALAFGLGSGITLICGALRIPPILPLLIAGVCVGTSGLGFVDANSLGQDGLSGFITVAISLLVFEGALSLDRDTMKSAPRAVRGLLTIGAGVTWLGVALLAILTLGMHWSSALVLGAILIVTGPTVVQPILRRIKLTRPLDASLKAEGILIDPIGAIIAVATLDIVLAWHRSGDAVGFASVWAFIGPFVSGGIFGFTIAWIAVRLMRAASADLQASHERQNLFAMAACMTAVGFSELFYHESGLVAAAVSGVVIANAGLKGVRELRHFKEQISAFLVAALFILLASRFDVARLGNLGVPHVLFILGVMLLVRTAGVWASTSGSTLTPREKTFLALTAPRGIVAAAIASIAAIGFDSLDDPELQADGQAIELLTFAVIVVSVASAGSLSGVLARFLGVQRGEPNGVIFIGAHRLSRELAVLISAHDIPVRLIDVNPTLISSASTEGLPATLGDATDLSWMDEKILSPDYGWVFAATGNADVDQVVSRWAETRLGKGKALGLPVRGREIVPDRLTLDRALPLSALIAKLDTDAIEVAEWTEPREDGVLFAVIQDGKLRLSPLSEAPPEDDGESTRIGILFANGSPTPAPDDDTSED